MEPDEKGKLVKKTYETNKFGEQKIKYEWEFVHTHVYPNVNDAIIEYLISNNLCFELKGLPVQELPIKKPENAMLLKSEFISEKVEHLESNNQSKPKPTVKESSVAQSNEKNLKSKVIDDYNSSLLQNQQAKKPAPKIETNEKSDKKKKKKNSFMNFFGL